ncbi:aminomethyl transferase family protein [Sphingobium sp. B11D3D]|uniref:aminomethyl transferase family protein n=1 Tax=Sphingobium sp. B11D3D TaxID=2940576 RepID=UPI0022241DFB|nr:aminomethyl transferase family protein [Sphingobium sp. B11D3D]MCW2370072.1 syringate O-demethylase/vanillate/3-O-methylgallate O-demethylase [Sphingobium sp. B11D3D]
MVANLQEKIDRAGGALPMLRNSEAGLYVFPVQSEFTNWRIEQHAWREGVALMDQSFHMVDLYVKGPDVFRFISQFAVNSFEKFGEGKAKQFIACAESGYLIGDMVIFGLADNTVNLVGKPSVANWIEYQVSRTDMDVWCERDERTVNNAKPRKNFRFEIQGPKAWKLLEKLNGSAVDVPRFFQMGTINVSGRTYQSLRHGMGGAPGLEFWGDFDHYDEVKAAILEAGVEFDLKQVGARAYSSAAADSGWMACPLPAFYSGDDCRAFREWLPANSFDGVVGLGGSFVSDRIEDYYFTPWDLDYGRLIRFDHDFVGRDALAKMEKETHRKKVSLVFNRDDLATLYRSQLTPGQNGKAMELPLAHYAAYPYDTVLDKQGNQVGVSTYTAFLAPDGAMVSIASVDEAFAAEGTELTIAWGEKDSRRPNVEPHVPFELRAQVSGWPFSEKARESYRSGR